MPNKAKLAFGSSQNIATALESGVINERDVLFLDETTDNPKIGWISKTGETVIVEGKECVVTVDGESLPETGETGKIYIFEGEGYVWDEEAATFVTISKSVDLSEFETKLNQIEEKLEEVSTVNEVIEF